MSRYNSSEPEYNLIGKVFYHVGTPFYNVKKDPWEVLIGQRSPSWSIFGDDNGLEVAQEVICLADEILRE